MKKNFCPVFVLCILFFMTACSLQKNVMQQGSLLSDGKYAANIPDGVSASTISKLSNQQFLNPFKPQPNKLSNPANLSMYSIDTTKEDTSKQQPILQPLIPAGAGVFAAGMALTAVSVISGGLSIFIGIGAFVLGLLLTNWGYKKVKADSEKWKGEKLALAVYYALIPVGLFLMLYPVYLLFIL